MTVAVLQSQTAAESICTLGQGQTSISLVMDDSEWEGRKGRLTHLKEDKLSYGLAVNTVRNSEKTLLKIPAFAEMLKLCCPIAANRTRLSFRQLGSTEFKRFTDPDIQELAVSKVGCCVALRLPILSSNVALERTAKLTAEGQQACMFCACVKGKTSPPIQKPLPWLSSVIWYHSH